MFITQGTHTHCKKKIENSTEGVDYLNLFIYTISIKHINRFLKV